MSIIKYYILVLVVTLSQFSFANESVLIGDYYRSVSGKWEHDAKVYFYNGRLHIKFTKGCSAALVKNKQKDLWEAACVVGSGYGQILYQAKVLKRATGSEIHFYLKEYGDAELGFGQEFIAHKI